MKKMTCDVAVIGAGPAGLAAAVSAKENGAGSVIVIERDSAPGGILQQCIHPGFGLTRFGEELSGPEYYGRFVDKAKECGVTFMLNTMVLDLDAAGGSIYCVSGEEGAVALKAGSVVLAMGCRERTRAGIAVPGTRPAGIYTAGAAQRLINRQNVMVGRKVVILGSGDIGMIMARRLTLEGAEVVMVVELMDYLAGLTRNRVQCLEDFGIPLKLSHTITKITGDRRVEGVFVAPVDENKKPIPEKEEFVPCDTVLFSVGLIPENELSQKAGILLNPVTRGPEVDQHMETAVPGVFACGNVVHVNDLVDNVSAESERAGKYAALHARGAAPAPVKTVPVTAGDGVRYVCPQRITVSDEAEEVTLYFRVTAPKRNVVLTAVCGGATVTEKKEFRVNPGEMNHVTVKTADLSGNEVTVSVREA